jgi:hypothetical protein
VGGVASPGEVAAWFAERLPGRWYGGPVEVAVDREEILVVGPIPDPEPADDADGRAIEAARAAAARQFRERTREARTRLAGEAEHRFGRKVSWGVTVGGDRFVFTHLAVPVMTRLRMGEREVLDTLIGAGVARSRSEALAWCVRLVGRHQSDWIAELRDALVRVEELRARAPLPGAAGPASGVSRRPGRTDAGAPRPGRPRPGPG